MKDECTKYHMKGHISTASLMLIAHTSPLIFLSRGLEPISEGETFTDNNDDSDDDN